MKLRSLAVAAVLGASALAFLPSTASAWTCPPNTVEVYITNPVTGAQHRACRPDLNCETCFGITL